MPLLERIQLDAAVVSPDDFNRLQTAIERALRKIQAGGSSISTTISNAFTTTPTTLARGPMGMMVDDGEDGLDGLPGRSGADGLRGSDGRFGIDGLEGDEGLQGIPGVGFPGAPGRAGRDGIDGQDGDDISPGPPGGIGMARAQFWISTPDVSAPYGVNMGALGAGTLQQTVAGAVATPSAFAGTAGSIPFYVAGSQLGQDNANFFWDNTNKRLGIGTNAPGFDLDILLNANAARGFRVTNTNAGASAQVQNQLVNNAGSLAYYGIASSAFAGFFPLDAGKAFFGSNSTHTSIFTQSAHDIILSTNAIERARVASGGNVSIANLNAGGVTYATAATGVLKIGTSTEVASAITWPAATRFHYSTSTSTAPVGNAGFIYDTGDDVVEISNGLQQAWYNIGSLGTGNYERVKAFWSGNVFNLTSEAGGTGTVRAMKIDASTATLTLHGALTVNVNSDFLFFQPDTVAGIWDATGWASITINTVGNSGANFDANRAVIQGSPTTASSASYVLDAVKLSAGVTFTNHTAITTAAGVNGVSIPAPNYIGDGSGPAITNAASLYLAGPPFSGAGSVTFTNKYTLWVDDGISRFDGNGTHVFELPADATVAGAQTGRIPIKAGGATVYLHYFNG